MKKAIALSVLIMCVLCATQAQDYPKVPYTLKKAITENNSRNAVFDVHILVEGDLTGIEEEVAKTGGFVKYAYGNMASVVLPSNKVFQFSESDAVKRFGDYQRPTYSLMDTSLIINNIDSVHSGLSPLAQAYTGQGVIIGIIDEGIDIYHADFLNDDSTTRIRYLWDMDAVTDTTAPLPYNYGKEWNWLDINAGECTHVEYPDNHGSHVAGIAASDGSAVGDYKGVAPDAELIVVDIADNGLFGPTTRTADAVDYIFRKATAMGKPCVINTSYGSYFGSHDANDLVGKMLDTMLDEQDGRVIVASAGNFGHRTFHLGYDVTNTARYTWFKPLSGDVVFAFYGDTADMKDLDFAFIADNPVTWTSKGGNDPYNLSDYNLTRDTTILIKEDIRPSFTKIGDLDMYVTLNNGVYEVEVIITPQDQSDWWRLETSGSGRFDCWSEFVATGTSDMVKSGELPPDSLFPWVINYVLPDNEKTIVSSWQCSDKVIPLETTLVRSFM